MIDTLTEWRTDDDDDVFRAAFKYAQEMYQKVEDMPDAQLPMPRCAGRQKHRNNVVAVSPEQYFKRAVWYPLLDCTISELRQRFSEHSKLAMRMCSLLPSYCVGIAFDAIAPSIILYEQFLTGGSYECQCEYDRWQRKWKLVPQSERPTTVTESLKSCDISIYPNIAVLLRIFATIPVSNSTAERSFSELRLLKSYLRSTMMEDRLNGLALMAIHKDCYISYDAVISQYARDHNPRFRFS